MEALTSAAAIADEVEQKQASDRSRWSTFSECVIVIVIAHFSPTKDESLQHQKSESRSEGCAPLERFGHFSDDARRDQNGGENTREGRQTTATHEKKKPGQQDRTKRHRSWKQQHQAKGRDRPEDDED